MPVCSNLVRTVWLFFEMAMALCFFGGQALAELQGAKIPPPAIPAGSYRIAGTVVSKTDGRPLARTRVTVRDVKDSQKFQFTITGEDGRYEFASMPAGKYSLGGAKRGFISAGYEQHDQFSTAIVTGSGLDTESLVLRLAPDAVIAGRVLDEAGDPVRHATVTLYYDDHSSGVDQIRQYRSGQTDDLGEYEVTPLRPGTYFLSASGRPWYAVHPQSDSDGQAVPSSSVDRSLDVAYPVTFYPDVTDAESAMPIPIRGGERVQVDIHLTPVPSLRILFHTPHDNTNTFSVPLLQQPAFEGYTSVQTATTRGISPGVLEITGIPAGRYNVRIHGPGSIAQMNGVDLTKDGEEIDTSKGDLLSTVKVSVNIPGEAALPQHLTIGLRSGNREIVASQAVDSKGTAELQQVAVGRYEVAVWGGEKPYSIAHLSTEGADASGHELSVTAGSSPLVSLTLVGGSAEVQGTAKKAGKAFAGAMVVLVPIDPKADRDLFRRDQSDLDGTFVLHGVIPGSYTLLAIENGWDLDWSQPGVIAAYVKHGLEIKVGNQVGRPTNLEEPVEVQSK